VRVDILSLLKRVRFSVRGKCCRTCHVFDALVDPTGESIFNGGRVSVNVFLCSRARGISLSRINGTQCG
jgi:hypothetical protein